MTHEEKLRLARILNKKIFSNNAATQISVEKMLIGGDLNEKDLGLILNVYDSYVPEGKLYKKGERFRLGTKLYKVIQEYTTQAHYTPDQLHAHFLEIAPEGIIEDWKQPTGGHDAYAPGKIVKHKGKIWKNTHTQENTWEPGVYGWTIQP